MSLWRKISAGLTSGARYFSKLPKEHPASGEVAPKRVDGFDAAARVAPREAALRLAEVKTPGRVEISGVPRPPPTEGRLLVVNKAEWWGAPSVMLFDLKTGELRRTLDVGPEPHEAAVSPSGARAAVPHYVSQLETGDRMATAISVIDLKTETARRIDLPGFGMAHGVEWLDDERLAVSAEQGESDRWSGFVLIVNTRTGELEKSIRVGQEGSHLVRKSPDGQRLYTANLTAGTFSAIDVQAGRVIATLDTGGGTEGFDLSPDGKQIWVGAQTDDTISIIDAETLREVKRVKAEGSVVRIKFTPDGQYAVVVNRVSNDLALRDAKTGDEVKRIPLELPAVVGGRPRFGETSQPIAVAFDTTGKQLFVPNSKSELMTVIDTEAWAVAGYYRVGSNPDPVAWYPSG